MVGSVVDNVVGALDTEVSVRKVEMRKEMERKKREGHEHGLSTSEI